MYYLSFLKPFVALLAFTSVCFAQTYPDPEPCLGPACANPPGQLDYQDFSVIRRHTDGQYFRYSKSNETGLGLSVATAPTLRGPWHYAFQVLDGPLKSPVAKDRAATNVWAPEVHFINNTYYLFYGVNAAPFSFDLCVATSPTMDDNSWTDHGSMNVPEAHNYAYVRLDGNLLSHATDPSGAASRHYMVFGSYQHGLYGFHLAEDLLTIGPASAVQMVIGDQPNPPPFNTGTAGPNKTEGPFQLIHGNYIYLFYSMGNCCAAYSASYDNSVYRVAVCRTPIQDPLAPMGSVADRYVDRNRVSCLNGPLHREPTIVLYSHQYVYAPGSIGVLNDPVEGLVMYYQYKNMNEPDTGLSFGFNYLTFDDEEWPVLIKDRPSSKRRRRKGKRI